MSLADPVADPAPVPPKSLGALVADLYFSPGEAFAEIARAPRVVLPVVVLVVLNLAFTAVWVSKMDVGEFIRGQLEASGKELPPEQVEAAIAMQEKVLPPMAYVGAVVGAPLMIAALGGLFLLVYRSFFGSDQLTFRHSAAVVAWSFLTVGLVTTPLLFAVFGLRGEWSTDPQQAIQASPALLLDRGETHAGLYALASSFDLFTLWVLVLMGIGYGACVRRPASQAIWGVGSLWLGYVVVKVIWATLQG